MYNLDTSEEDLSDTVRSVSSQMGNKEMSGFTLFAKGMRIKSIYICIKFYYSLLVFNFNKRCHFNTQYSDK